MKYLFSMLLLAVSVSMTSAQTSQAKAILDKAAAQFKSYPAVEVEFTMAMDNQAEDIHETHQGKAWMKGSLYRLELMDVINYYDGKVIHTYMPEVQEVNIKNPSDEEEGFLSPANLFDIHNQGFTQHLVSSREGKAYIELIPVKEKNFSKIGIWVRLAGSAIEKVTSFGKDGNNVTVTLKAVREMKPVPADSFFRFDTAAHPEVEVVDMR